MDTRKSFINKNNVKIEYYYDYIEDKHDICRWEYSILLPKNYYAIDDMWLGLEDIDMYNEDDTKELLEKLEELSKEYHILEVSYSEHSDFSFHVYKIKSLEEINFLDLQWLVFFRKDEYSEEEIEREAREDCYDFMYWFNGRYMAVDIYRPIKCKNLETDEIFYIYEFYESSGWHKNEEEIHKYFDEFQINI